MIVDVVWCFVKRIKGGNHEGHKGSPRKERLRTDAVIPDLERPFTV
jgi:hypothetical protein